MLKLTNREGLAKLREASAAALKAETKKVLVCGGTGCVSGGSLEIYDKLKALMEANNIPCSVELDCESATHADSVGLKKSGCHGFCEMGPLVRVEPQGWLYTKVKLEDCEEIVEKTIKNGEHIERLAYQKGGVIRPKQEEIPFYEKQTRICLLYTSPSPRDS